MHIWSVNILEMVIDLVKMTIAIKVIYIFDCEYLRKGDRLPHATADYRRLPETFTDKCRLPAPHTAR